MTQIHITSIIRDRGQLTIPEVIRRAASWASPLSAVTMTVQKPDEITIRPHAFAKKTDWDMLWNSIRLTRSFKGKNEKKSARELIAEDRANR